MAAADALIAAEDEIAGLASTVRELRAALEKADSTAARTNLDHERGGIYGRPV